jgi:hypothetical protein
MRPHDAGNSSYGNEQDDKNHAFHGFFSRGLLKKLFFQWFYVKHKCQVLSFWTTVQLEPGAAEAVNKSRI